MKRIIIFALLALALIYFVVNRHKVELSDVFIFLAYFIPGLIWGAALQAMFGFIRLKKPHNETK